MSRSRRGNSDASSSQGPHGETFPFAHPPPKNSSKAKKSRQYLRLSTRRLLQIQQLQQTSSTPRVTPILELYRPSSFGKSIPLHNENKSRKVHGRDLYLTQSEPYTHLRNRNRSKSNGRSSVHSNGLLTPPGNGHATKPRSCSGASRSGASSVSGEEGGEPVSGGGGSSSEWKARFRSPRRRKASKDSAYASASASSEENEDEEENDVVAVIHTSPKPKAKGAEAPHAELFFPLCGWSWEASSPAPGRYRFRDDKGVVVFDWERRPPSRSGPVTAEKDDGERFVLGVCESGGETTSLKRPWLAQLSRRGIHVGGLEGWQGELGALMIDDGAGLYTLILTMAVWVAREAEWVG
ncbi:hypothetical protein ASPVEDRAFT_440039 [Aspergillus versicolor CBS 583.65]|uniref:Uncharacterized protein n=1 Tax=Aspergillus versicolor CBS 583.65 TaxID=1036611 RepID=A0A1L9P8X1_ASPVE|nr:uncharacterized protein ASPVEDRAFT_440039 [Aspergillus versicolor CBS 583.65]OJI97967.1 hypothetical protein ASPVEDRAFT_440039 [Aspergillus versicolor CBS 583.65]